MKEMYDMCAHCADIYNVNNGNGDYVDGDFFVKNYYSKGIKSYEDYLAVYGDKAKRTWAMDSAYITFYMYMTGKKEWIEEVEI